jgi:hypothetical protein
MVILKHLGLTFYEMSYVDEKLILATENSRDDWKLGYQQHLFFQYAILNASWPITISRCQISDGSVYTESAYQIDGSQQCCFK